MAEILLNKELTQKLFLNDNQSNSSDKDNPVRDVARTITITILKKLEGDKDRQEIIIHFLRDTQLYGFILINAHLYGINLSQVYLRKANLQEAHLEKANLQHARLEEANLQHANR